MKKLFTLLLALTMLVSLAACGDKKGTGTTDAPEAEQTTAAPERIPAANVDPTGMEWGLAENGSYTGDFWYPENGDTSTCILFQKANSDYAPAGCSYIKIVNGEEAEDFPCAVDADGNLIDADNAGKIKIAFLDDFTAYDYVADAWYSRGDMPALLAQLSGKSLVGEKYPEDSLELKADGTTAELYDGESYTGTWTLASPTVVNITRNDSVLHFKIQYDETGKITGLAESSFSSYTFA